MIFYGSDMQIIYIERHKKPPPQSVRRRPVRMSSSARQAGGGEGYSSRCGCTSSSCSTARYESVTGPKSRRAGRLSEWTTSSRTAWKLSETRSNAARTALSLAPSSPQLEDRERCVPAHAHRGCTRMGNRCPHSANPGPHSGNRQRWSNRCGCGPHDHNGKALRFPVGTRSMRAARAPARIRLTGG
jgi:hypothetical protein